MMEEPTTRNPATCARLAIVALLLTAAPAGAAVATEPGGDHAPLEPSASAQPLPSDAADEHPFELWLGQAITELAERSSTEQRPAQICVVVSTNPPAVGVYQDCGSGGGVWVPPR